MRELAVQAANDTNTNSDRASLQSEITQLVSELNRIGNQTEFNTIKLLDGTYLDQTFHIGFKANQTIAIGINDMRATALGARAHTVISDSVAVNSVAITAAGLVAIDGVSIRNTSSADDTLSTTLRSASAIAKAAAINDSTGLTGVTAVVQSSVVTGAAAISAAAVAAGDLVINNISVGVVTNVAANDQGGVLTAAINAVSSATGVTAVLDTVTGLISLTATDGRNVHISAQNGADTWFNSGVLQAKLQLTSLEDFVVGGSAASTIVGIDATLYTRDVIDVVSAINVSTRSGANASLATLDAGIDLIASQRASLGAVQNRLESTISNLQAVSENLSAAKSRIEDADFASETAALTRAQIIQQAGVSILAQANTSPQAVLSLLGG
jgi:flagellin